MSLCSTIQGGEGIKCKATVGQRGRDRVSYGAMYTYSQYLLQLLQAFADVQSEIDQHTICRALDSKETQPVYGGHCQYIYPTYTDTHTGGVSHVKTL